MDHSSSQQPTHSPVVSVIVINHNYGAYLRQAITSAVEQSYRPLEVVVVDDGSTDNSSEIIRSFGDQIVPILQPQAGHVSAFNTGFASATGEILFFLDADDLLYKTCAEQVVREWVPGVVKIQYRLDTIDHDGVDQNLPFPYFPPDLGPEEVLRQAITLGAYPWTVSSGNAFSRSLLEQLLPIPAERIFKSPDGYLNKMAPLYGAVKSLNLQLGAYRVHGTNAWAQAGDRINVASLTRWVHFDSLLHEEFRQRAQKAGIAVKPYDQLCNTQMLEYRLLSFRLAPAEHVFKQDTRAGLARRGLSSALVATNTSAIGRVAWIAWFIVIAYAPLPIVQAIFRMGRGQSKRGDFARWVVSISRGSARTLR